MDGDKLPANDSEPEARDAAQRSVRPFEFEPNARRATPTTRRTVGIYERPAQRARLSLPLVVILILSALVSVVAAARFLF
ncbi:MAG TPA: hypothetical protein VF527_08535 [Pyrinomonadaceae bacterium]|jgi:hypothetical protein